uniref:Jumonji family zinc finger protein, putative n=1 Tax=Theileria annulata TaxID=5874 RepID=A0A3B0MWV3_THEAN
MALTQKPKSPLLRSSLDNISISQGSLLSFPPETNKTLDSNLIYTTSGSRRSLRKIKKPNFFKITHDHRPDPELQAALKRSKIDTSNQDIDYSSITPVPVVYATKEEFSNPIKLWNKYTSLGEEFGAIKVIPPEDYTTRMPIDLDNFRFKVRQQRIQLLSNGTGFSHPSELWNCDKMVKYDNFLKNQIMGSDDPSLEAVEKEYWTMVRNADPRVTSFYGADLNVFSPNSSVKDNLLMKCETKDPWNLCNLPKCDGSLLKYINNVVPGVNSPWLYIGMIFTSFCWHTEDNYFGSVNFHHSGAPKVWYLVPPKKAPKMESILKNYSSLEGEEFALYGLRVQIPPDVLISNGVTLYRLVQKVNEFVMVWPRTFHCGFNAGFNCNEACNIAPGNWIKMGYKSLVNYKYARKTCIPFFRIILSSIPNVMELDANHIKSIVECLSLLISEEFQLRSRISYPKYQMFFDPEVVRNLKDLNNYLSYIDRTDFDLEMFIESMYKSYTNNNYKFLLSCKEMASFCIKDCDLCDTPTFGSAVLCNHINTIVCISCLNYHECDCKTRVVLYRYPLYTLYNIILILKRVYFSMTGLNLKLDPEYNTPKEELLIKLDSSSSFSFKDFQESNHSDAPADENLKYKCNKIGLIRQNFEDITQVCRKLTNARMKGRKKKLDKIVIINGDSLENPQVPVPPDPLEYVTKLSLKYTILALEEDTSESQV